MSDQKSLKDETKKVTSVASEEKRAFVSKKDDTSRSYNLLKRPQQFKLSKTPAKPATKELAQVEVLHVDKQEKSAESKGWNLAALHAHQCCASQKHPAFVHLQQLLAEGSKLDQERVKPLKFKEYLLAAKTLETFVTEHLEEKSSKQRTIAPISEEKAEEEDDKNKELWDEYLHSQEERLFQVPRVSKNLMN